MVPRKSWVLGLFLTDLEILDAFMMSNEVLFLCVVLICLQV